MHHQEGLRGAPAGVATVERGAGQQVDPKVVLTSIGEAVYDWDVAADTLSWSGNALSLFRVDDVSRISSGAAFSQMIDPISPSTRAETILLAEAKDQGGGVPYRVSFAIQPDRQPLQWFEDSGRWFAGADGRPVSAHGVVRRIDGPTEAERREIASSKIDPLTGGFLRGPFIRIMADDIDKAAKAKKSAIFLLIAIDDLSVVGRDYGFEAADEVLAGVAARIRMTIRRKDRLMRYSSSRLGVLLSTFSDGDVAEAASRMMGAVSSEPIRISAGSVAVSLRVGAVACPQDGNEPIALLRRAEEALDEARQGEAAHFVAYRADARREAQRKLNFSASDDVLRALNERRVTFALEPVLAAHTRVLQFNEVLVRVMTEDGAALGAGGIIPAAERFGLVKFVDIRVLDMAIDLLAQEPHQRLSVNVSMRTAVTPEWMTALSNHIVQHPGVADRLIVEITETAAMADIDATAAIVCRIKDLGVRVAIDDFGSGHTSFRSLRALPVDILKIDGVFVQNLARSTDDRFFVRTLVDLARHLGVQTVAEWVQDEDSARMLADWGVTFLQGELCGLAKLYETPPEEAGRFIA